MSPIERAAAALLAGQCTPAVVRAIEGGDPGAALWQALEDSGFLEALAPESAGGAGLPLAEVEPLVRLAGYHAMPLPMAETMLARALRARAGQPARAGMSSWDALRALLPDDERHAWQAAVATAQIAGAAQRVLELSVTYAQQRVQFGKPIASFQAIQHQLAVMAEQTQAAHMASQLAWTGAAGPLEAPDPVRAAMAKLVAGEAAALLASAGHAVHGAIGITAEYDLQLYTRRLLAWRAVGGSPAGCALRVGRAWWDSGLARSTDVMLHQLAAADAPRA